MMNCTMHHSYVEMGKQLYLLITDILIVEMLVLLILINTKRTKSYFDTFKNDDRNFNNEQNIDSYSSLDV